MRFKHILLFAATVAIVLSIIRFAHAGPAVVFSGSAVKTLKPNISLNGGQSVLSGSLDPSVTAVFASEGSIYLSTSGKLYIKQDAGLTTNWALFQTSASSGTVTSVALSLPGSVFSVSGSPVTTTGTLTGSFVSQTTNKVLASPNGSTGAPTFRALVAADIPNISAAKITSGQGSLTTSTSGVSVGSGTNALLSNATINVATASGSQNGLLSSTDWNTFNSKQSPITTGNLTDVSGDGIVITGGTNSVIGSGTNLSQTQSGSSTNGYLSSGDWNTFNGKQDALTFTDSLVNSSGTVTLVGDTASPGASKYYGTDGSSVLGFYTFPSSGATVALDNLASTAVNANITPDAPGAHTVGSSAYPFGGMFSTSLNAQDQYGDGGTISILGQGILISAPAPIGGFPGGQISVKTSDSSTNASGFMEFKTGDNSGSTTSGSMSFTTGSTTSAPASGITITAGSSSGNTGGNIILTAGGGSSAPNAGSVQIQDGNSRSRLLLSPNTVELDDNASAAVLVGSNANRTLFDETGTNAALQFMSNLRELLDEVSTPAVTFLSNDRKLIDETSSPAITFLSSDRGLYDNAGNELLDYQLGQLFDAADGATKLDWNNSQELRLWDHIVLSGNNGFSPPSISSCGSGASVSGGDSGGVITVGTGGVTSCTVTFGATWTSVPNCFLNIQDLVTGYASETTSDFTITTSADVSGDVIKYHCEATP